MENSDESLVERNTHYLSWPQRLSFSVGHVFNDLCAAFWFSYLLIFNEKINAFTNTNAGNLMLIGQIADGIATPFIGIECDRHFNWWICKYGRRKAWHLVGSLCVLFSFPFLFNRCIYCEESPQSYQIIYYAAFIIIFQFGWAAVQIAHLALIPDLTPISSERVELNTMRYAFTVISNIAVYLFMLGMLAKNGKGGDDTLNESDAITFREVSFIILGVGVFFTTIFHIGVREKVSPGLLEINSAEAAISDSSSEICPNKQFTWIQWFKQSQFYNVGLVYMGTRLTINLTQIFIPNYLQETLQMSKKSIAYIPLVVYVSGMVASLLMKQVSVRIGQKYTFLVGSIIALIACVWIFFGGEDFKKYQIFIVAVLIGVSGTTMIISSFCITTDLIGQNTSSGAFVFGSMSFADKVSNGVAVEVIEYLKSYVANKNYYRDVLSIVGGGSTLLALVALGFLSKKKIGVMKRNSNANSVIDSIDRRRQRDQEQATISSPLLANYDDSS